MDSHEIIEGFSGFTTEEKIAVISKLTRNSGNFYSAIQDHLHRQSGIQKKYYEFSENTLSNFFLPYSIAPNFLINNRLYHIPMVTEESSVVAAASSAAKFWSKHGGFRCRTIGKIKKGQIHFRWNGDAGKLSSFFEEQKSELLQSVAVQTRKMENRGGGIRNMELLSKNNISENYYQLEISFDTVDSMGANFMNTCLESIASHWKRSVEENSLFSSKEKNCDILMSIFSNYTPEYITKCEVKTSIASLKKISGGYSAGNFAERFVFAVNIAQKDIGRAVTHNKGIFNGIDAVAIATGNDFRAIEANGHAYASREGQYRSLSKAFIDGDEFNFGIEVPLSMGIVGGSTNIHPLAGYSLEILDCHSASELQGIALAAGLANNFSAIRALITSGIQSGHMSLHLLNILNQIHASENEKDLTRKYFKDKLVSYADVKSYIDNLRAGSHD